MIHERPAISALPDADVCIVGAGPVGLAAALRLAELGRSVLVLEAGNDIPQPDASGAFDIERVDRQAHASGADVTRQGLGGTSSAWGARCSPYDPIDFERRMHVAHSGAPISYDEVSRYHAAASAFLGVDSAFDAPGSCAGEDAVRTSRYMRVSSQANMGERHRALLTASDRITVALGTRVAGLDLDPVTGAITSIEVLSGGSRAALSPKFTILCCGGVQNARMLLAIQRTHPLFLGGEAGPVGRYYMGHLTGSVARVVFDRPADARPFLFRANPDGSFQRRCMTFGAGTQVRDRLLNTYFAPVSYPLADAGYRSGALSALHIGLVMRYASANYMQRFRPGHMTTPYDFGTDFPHHLVNVVRQPVGTVGGLLRVATERLGYTQRLPLFQFENPRGIYALRYHAEHAPDPDSRVTLSAHTDSDGVPLPRVDLRYSSQDVSSVERAHAVLSEWLEKRKLGRVQWLQPKARRQDHIRAQARDGYHQIGLTRMSASARTGVVDTNLAVHGTKNLFVAGCSVLPTSSHAHPTFTAVSLALRLAEYLGPLLGA